MTRRNRREIESDLDELAEDTGDQETRPIVGPDGILAPPEWFGYGGDADE